MNDCLHPGPPLQNRLWDILVKSRFYPILLTGDLKKAFLQIRIKEQERDSLRFHWKEPSSDNLIVYRFTRALFGLTSSPFLLAGVLNHHLDQWKENYPEVVKEIDDNLYVDDLMMGGATVPETREKKTIAAEVFEDAAFTIHKWHSNESELEGDEAAPRDENCEGTYAKQQLGGTENHEGKLLGLPWNREKDTLSIEMSAADCSSKRSVLSELAKIYDPLGLVSPSTLVAKLLYREICDAKISWDETLPETNMKVWKKCKELLQGSFVVPRSLAPHHLQISEIWLHAFGDASSKGVCAVVYAVVHQQEEVTQGLVCAKSRIAKRNLTIPRLELIAGHMAVNLVINVNAAVTIPLIHIHCWLDSTVALYCIKRKGDYRQFVTNRVQKIPQHGEVTWHHVPTRENPADLGSRGGDVKDNQLWQEGPAWLKDPSRWPQDVTLVPDEQTRAEEKVKVKNEIAAATVIQSDVFDELLEKYHLPKVLRILGYVRRFVSNCKRQTEEKVTGPISTDEVEQQELWWIRRAQQAVQDDAKFRTDQLRLNLLQNDQQIVECRGRISGEYPIYLPDSQPFTLKVVQQAHILTLHGGVGLTMAKVRERFWVPRLRQLVKRIRRKCNGCKRFQVKAYHVPPPGKLPKTRTEGDVPFQVIGVDFAGPIRYQRGRKTEGKAYLAMFACSLTRAIHLELVTSLKTEEFIACLKRFIARRGRPKVVYSDNGATFQATAKWLQRVRKDEQFHSLLASFGIKWRFNLSRAPWWGGQFERLIGLFKNAFYKSVGNGTLKWSELEDVILDVEVALNNRPLTYLEDDIELPVLTPNSLLQVNATYIPEEEAHHIAEKDLRKRARFLRRCKQAVWDRWSREYVRGLREQHRQTGNKNAVHPKIGEVVIVREENKPRNTWRTAVVTRLITGKDGVVRGAVVKTGKGTLERAVQHLFPLELSCDLNNSPQLNPDATDFHPRPKRAAAEAARVAIRELAENEQSD